MAWVTPIITWDGVTLTPVDLKHYNFGDLNRVEGNTIAVQALMATLGYTATLGTTIINRTNVSIDFYDSLSRVESNILALKTGLGYTPTGWITPKTNWTYNQPFDYNDANRLEIDLNLLYTTLNNIFAEMKYCGQPNAICGTDAYYL